MNENILNKDCTQDEYLQLVEYCNDNNLRIEQSENYFYGLAEYERLDGDTVIDCREKEDYKQALNFLEIERIKDDLIELDNKSLRPLRSILTSLDNPPQNDINILKNYEQEAEKLRNRIQELENAQSAESEDIP